MVLSLIARWFDKGADPVQTAKFLGNVPLFKWMEPDQLAKLAALTKIKHVKKGHVLVKQGERSDDVYVVASGRFEAAELTPDKHAPRHLGALAAGDIVGEIALLTGAPRSATVTAQEDSVVAQFSHADFINLEANTEFLHFKLWSAFCLHSLETFAAHAGLFPELDEQARRRWLGKYSMCEVKAGELLQAPEGTSFVFVADGAVQLGTRDVTAPFFGPVPPATTLTTRAAAKVVWLPKPA